MHDEEDDCKHCAAGKKFMSKTTVCSICASGKYQAQNDIASVNCSECLTGLNWNSAQCFEWFTVLCIGLILEELNHDIILRQLETLFNMKNGALAESIVTQCFMQ